jgi:hypothetical protein
MWKKGRGTTKWKLGDVETVVDAAYGPFDKLRAGSAEETHVACHGYCSHKWSWIDGGRVSAVCSLAITVAW